MKNDRPYFHKTLCVCAKSTIISLISLFFSPTLAERPLYVEGLVPEAGTWKLDTSVAYGNRENQGLQIGNPLIIQTGPTSFVSVYTDVGEERKNTDIVVGTVGLRYGLTTRTELYVRASAFWSDTRSAAAESVYSASSKGLSDIWFGTSYQIKDDDESPGLIGFSQIALMEKTHNTSSQFKSAMIGLAAYKAIDPVVFSMNTALSMSTARGEGENRHTPGSLFLISGSVAFAANDRVSLSGGAQWTNKQPDSVAGEKSGFRTTSTDLLLGVGYGVTAKSIVNISMISAISGRKGADLNLAWSYAF